MLIGNEYQNRRIDFKVEATDTWLDLGANIGTFAVLAISAGGRVVSVEPEPDNLTLLRKNMEDFGGKYKIVEGVVGLKKGSVTLYIATGSYNKYRHSVVLNSGGKRTGITVRAHAMGSLLRESVRGHKINAIKMDIEGAEIELLEEWGSRLGNYVNKLVFEYSFDADRSIARFLNIIKELRKSFRIVHHRKIDPTMKEYTFYPPATTVFCMR